MDWRKIVEILGDALGALSLFAAGWIFLFIGYGMGY
jgi:uncharacterized membrane protein YGL010W